MFLYERNVPWYLAGTLGTAVGSVWNFSVTSVLIWRDNVRSTEKRAALARQGDGVEGSESSEPHLSARA